jgi:hypothetical protein
MATRQRVDHTALRTNQAFIIILLAMGFVAAQPWLVVFVCAVMALGTAVPQAALFQRIYRDVLRPAGVLKPDVREEDPAPHRFAQGLGAAVLLAAGIGGGLGPGICGHRACSDQPVLWLLRRLLCVLSASTTARLVHT